jgi:hypothetical protein
MTIFPDIFVGDGVGTEVGAFVATATGVGTEVGASVAAATGVGVGVAVAGPHAADNAMAIMTTKIITLWNFIFVSFFGLFSITSLVNALYQISIYHLLKLLIFEMCHYQSPSTILSAIHG